MKEPLSRSRFAVLAGAQTLLESYLETDTKPQRRELTRRVLRAIEASLQHAVARAVDRAQLEAAGVTPEKN